MPSVIELKGTDGHHGHLEQVLFLDGRPSVEVHHIPILQVQVLLLQPKGYSLPDLTCQRDVAYVRLLHSGLVKELFRIEPDLVVKQDYVLVCDPSPDFLVRLALDVLIVRGVAHVKDDHELVGVFRVVLAPDHQLVRLDTLELALPDLDIVNVGLSHGVRVLPLITR